MKTKQHKENTQNRAQRNDRKEGYQKNGQHLLNRTQQIPLQVKRAVHSFPRFK